VNILVLAASGFCKPEGVRRVLAHRNPMLLFVLSGLFLLRYAHRAFSGLLFPSTGGPSGNSTSPMSPGHRSLVGGGIVNDELWRQITSFGNLWNAACLARKGKRFTESAASFERNLGQNLTLLRDELTDETYQPGRYTTFTIFEPARRLISAAPYRDRVVHHALCHVIEPLFERAFVFDSYANRKGKGTHAVLDRATHFARRYAVRAAVLAPKPTGRLK
jgi:hypothetical protein